MSKIDMDDVVEKVGDRIHAGELEGRIGYQAIGAVAACRANFPHLALAEMSEEEIAQVEQALRDSGVDIPCPPHTTADPTGR